jgi:hypothetical protein
MLDPTVGRGAACDQAPALTGSSPQPPAVFDLADYGSSFARTLPDGRVQVEFDPAPVTIVGTAAQLLDLGAMLASHTHAAAVELAR